MAVLTQKQLEQRRQGATATTAPQTTTTEPEIIDIRARQSEIERQAETAKATVREVARRERRARELPLKPQRTKGIARAVAEVETARKEAHAEGKVVAKAIGKVVAEHEKQLQGIAKYKSGDGYDLVMMIQDGYTPKQLTELGFASDVITKSQDRVAELTKADKYKGTDGYDVVAMVNDGWTQSQLEDLFGKDAAGEAITRADVINRAEKYKSGDGYDVAAMVRDNFPEADMAKLFDTSTVTQATNIVKADKYKTDTGYDLLAMFNDGYAPGQTKTLGFDTDAVDEAWGYHQALGAMKPYKNTDGTYDVVKIAEAVNKGTLDADDVTKVLGANPAQYLTAAQVSQIQFAASDAQAYQMGDAWGVNHEQVDKIRDAPPDTGEKVYVYLQENAPGAIELSHPSQLPSFQQTPDWQQLASALQDVDPYKLEGGQYDVAKAYQAMTDGKLSKASFIVAFGQDTYNDTKAFYNTNVEIKPGEWVAKTEWEALTKEQQKDFIGTGQYTITPAIPQDGKSQFEYLQSTGEIHPLAEYKSYDEKTGEVSYLAPDTDLSMDEIMKYWNEMKPSAQQVQINSALGLHPFGGGKSFDELTKAEQDKVLRYYTKSYLQVQLKGQEQYFKDLWEEEKVQLKEMGLGMIPVYGTIRNWNNMSNTWRGISIALDLACVIPFVTAGARAIKGAVSPLRAQAGALAKAELAAGKDMAKTLTKTYNNRALGRAYSSMTKAQASYTKALAKVAQLKAKGKAVPLSAQRAASRAELTLRTRATTFVNKLNLANSSIKGARNIPVRFDSPEVKGLMSSLGNEMVQNSKAAINALVTRPGNVRALTRAVARAEAALTEAQAKWPKDASKWVDLMYEVARAEGKLAQAKTGSVTTLYQKLLKARAAGKTAEAVKLQGQFDTAIKSMEVEWGRGGFFRGRPWGSSSVATDVGTKPFLPSTGVSPAAIAAATGSKGLTGVQAGIVAIIIKAGAGTGTDTTRVTTPEVIDAAKKIATSAPQTRGVTTPEVIALTDKMVEASIKSATEGKTQAEIKASVISEVKSALQDVIETKAITQPQFKTLLNVTVKTATKLAQTFKTHYKPIPPMPKAEKTKDGRPIYPKGTVVFKMGKTKRGAEYKAMLPPYNQAKLVSSRKPPVGMRRTEGTPSQTLTVIGDKKLPFDKLSADIGIADVFVDTKRRKIRFAPGLHTNVGQRIPSNTRGVSLGNNMQVVRDGQIYYSHIKGDRGFTMSRHNPRRRRGRRI